MKTTVLTLLLLLATLGGLEAQSASELISEARILLEANNYAAADAKLSQIPPQDARAASAAYAEFGLIEFERRNFRNAYAAFRAALLLQSTNQTAAQYYLRMRREMNVNDLRNEYGPPPAAVAAAAVTPAAEPETQARAEPPQPQTPAERKEDLQILIAQLRAAEDRLNMAQTSVTSTQSENETLRRQLESQRQMVEQILANMRAAPPTPAPSRIENEQLAQTIRLLSELADRDADRPLVVQPDPAIHALLTELSEDRREAFDPFSERNLLNTMFLLIVGFLSLLVIALLVWGLLRSRRQKIGEGGRTHAAPMRLENPVNGSYLAGVRNPALLEFKTGQPYGDEPEITRSLVRAEHLQKMHEDVRKGALSWETVRTFIDDLEKSLRTDILRVVETKLDSGTLLSDEAILPVLFPFLTDYDDYLRSKAEELAKKAVRGARASRGSAGDDGLFSQASLLAIPKKLAEITRGKDRSFATAQVAFGIAKKLGLARAESEDVYKGGLAHDAGYLILDAGRLQRIMAKEEITDDEWNFIQGHVDKGLEYFGEAEIPEMIRDIMLHHHERNDGSGYPRGLTKGSIPLAAQIIGVAETFTSLIAPRSYRDRHEVGHALAIIRDSARKKFDPEIVAALEEVVKADGGLG